MSAELFLSMSFLTGNPYATKAIYVLTTGGTLEKVYSERTGDVANLESKIGRYLSKLRLPECELNVVPVMNKDSLEMTDTDRTLLLGMVRAILKANAPIVITHGTDTMVQTGMCLQQAIPNLQMPIVLTGAMTPPGFEGSDGLQNLTESLPAVQLLLLIAPRAKRDARKSGAICVTLRLMRAGPSNRLAGVGLKSPSAAAF